MANGARDIIEQTPGLQPPSAVPAGGCRLAQLIIQPFYTYLILNKRIVGIIMNIKNGVFPPGHFTVHDMCGM